MPRRIICYCVLVLGLFAAVPAWAQSAPDTVPTITSVDPSSYSVVIGWNAVPRATYYRVTACAASRRCLASIPVAFERFFEHTSGVAGLVYEYQVAACNSFGCSAYSDPEEGVKEEVSGSPGATLDAPSFLNIDPSDTGVALVWQAVEDATHYEVWLCSNDELDSCDDQSLHTTSSTFYEHTTSTPGATYYYRLKACDGAGCSDLGNHVVAERPSVFGPNLNPPVLLNVDISSSSVFLSWQPVEGINYYLIWVCSSASVRSCSSPGSTQDTYYEHSSGNFGVTYYYRITACSDAGCSEYSDFVAAARQGTSPSPGNSAPAAPSIEDADSSTTGFEFNWRAVATATEYEVWICTSTSAGSCNFLTVTPNTQLNHTSGAEDETFYYRVRGCNDSGCSDFSAPEPGGKQSKSQPTTGDTLPAPSFRSIDPSRTGVDLDWFRVLEADYYDVYRCDSVTLGRCVYLVSTPVPSFEDTNGIALFSYFYRVQACDSSGCGEFSEYALAAKEGLGGSLIVDWPAPFNGVTLRSGFNLGINNLGFYNPEDELIYSCIKLVAEGIPIELNGFSSFDIVFRILPSGSDIRVVQLRPFNLQFLLNERSQFPDCSGTFDAVLETYSDVLDVGGQVFDAVFDLSDPAFLDFRLRSSSSLGSN